MSSFCTRDISIGHEDTKTRNPKESSCLRDFVAIENGSQCTIRIAMARRIPLTFELTVIAAAAILVLTWPLPLRWWAIAVTAVALTAVTIETLRRARRCWNEQPAAATLAAAAAVALATVGSVTLGYAAVALVQVGVFGPVTRLGYPFLVAAGLRLEGGAWLAMLCVLVSIVPILFRDERISAAS